MQMGGGHCEQRAPQLRPGVPARALLVWESRMKDLTKWGQVLHLRTGNRTGRLKLSEGLPEDVVVTGDAGPQGRATPGTMSWATLVAPCPWDPGDPAPPGH